MTDPLESLDRQRDRWRRARPALHLDDPQSASFGLDSLGSRVRDLSVRFVILPSDPELHLVEFDHDLEKWWLSDFPDPISAGGMRWGTSYQPTASAALRCDFATGTELNHYVGLRRDGGLDMALGRNGGSQYQDIGRLWLTAIVGRIWCACRLYGDIVARINAQGPYELSVGVIGTSKRLLAGFGEGWAEPGTDWDTPTPSTEENLLLRRELESVAEDSAQSLAFSFGAEIEDAFGSNSRRFIARLGECSGRFDHRRYRWP